MGTTQVTLEQIQSLCTYFSEYDGLVVYSYLDAGSANVFVQANFNFSKNIAYLRGNGGRQAALYIRWYIYRITHYNDIVFPFGIDPDTGDYGYIKAGADTVTPFKSGGGDIIIYLGSKTNRSSSALSISITQFPDYASMSTDNFIVGIIPGTYTGSGSYTTSNVYISTAVSLSYNASTGVVTANIRGYMHVGGSGNYPDFRLFLVPNGISNMSGL